MKGVEEADKVDAITPGLTGGQLLYVKVALIGPLQGPSKRRRLLRWHVLFTVLKPIFFRRSSRG